MRPNRPLQGLHAIALWMSVGSLSMGGDAAAETPPAPFVFIGERVSIDEVPDPCRRQPAGVGQRCVAFDTVFDARYRVVRKVVGAPTIEDGETIEFAVADHYGYPPFGRYRYALLFVEMHGNPRLYKYQGVPLHLNDEGRWAACGDIRVDPNEPLPELAEMHFPTPIARWRDLSQYERKAYRSGEMPHWRKDRGEVWCTQGVPVEGVYRLIRDGVMRGFEVSLPEWPRQEARPGLEDRDRSARWLSQVAPLS